MGSCSALLAFLLGRFSFLLSLPKETKKEVWIGMKIKYDLTGKCLNLLNRC